MPRLEELITSDSVRGLDEAYRAGLLVIEQRNDARHPTMSHDEMDINETVVRHVYNRLMETARVVANPPNPLYPYLSSANITTILRGDMTKEPRGVAQMVFRLLVGNGIGWKQSRGRAPFYLRVWPEGEPLRWMGHHAHTTEDWRTEQAIARENGNPKMVMVTHDLTIMGVPAMRPEAIKEWIGRFVPAALDVQRERDQLAERVAELEAKLAEVYEADDWEEVGQVLADALGGRAYQFDHDTGVVLTDSDKEAINGE